jgi:hypothetical protein
MGLSDASATMNRRRRLPEFLSGRKRNQGIANAFSLLEHFHNCCGADWLICGRLAIGLVDSAPQAKRIANPLQDTILPHNICESSCVSREKGPIRCRQAGEIISLPDAPGPFRFRSSFRTRRRPPGVHEESLR